MGVKASSGMALPMLNKMYIQRNKVSSQPFPPSTPLAVRDRDVLNQSERSSSLRTE
jgi:hypothetical protein